MGPNAITDGRGNAAACRPFEGILSILKSRYDETDSFATQWELEQYMSYQTCPDCKGSRLRRESLAIKVARPRHYDMTHMSIKQALVFFRELTLTEKETTIAQRILKRLASGSVSWCMWASTTSL